MPREAPRLHVVHAGCEGQVQRGSLQLCESEKEVGGGGEAPVPVQGSPPTAAPGHNLGPTVTSREQRPSRASRGSAKIKAPVQRFSHTLRKRRPSLARRARGDQNESDHMESSGGHSVPANGEVRYGRAATSLRDE